MWSEELRGCSCGREPARELALVKGLNFTLPLLGNFLAFLAGLDLARMCHRRASPSECVYMTNFQSSWARSRVVDNEISPRRVGPLINVNKFCKGFQREGRSRQKSANPSWRAGSLPYKHHLNGFYLRKHTFDVSADIPLRALVFPL